MCASDEPLFNTVSNGDDALLAALAAPELIAHLKGVLRTAAAACSPLMTDLDTHPI